MSLAHRLTDGLAPQGIGATYALGAAGGALALALGLPLGMLLGSLLTVAFAAAAGVRLLGQPVAVPQRWRYVLIPVIGIAIGANFPPDFAAQASRWWVTLAALVLFVPLAHAMGYLIFRRLGRIDARTAFFAAMPGGFIEALEMGEKAGAQMPMLIVLQFLRLILCIVAIPLAFALAFDQAVGSGSGLVRPGADMAMGLRDLAVLVGCAVLGWWGAARLRMPAAVLAGPLLLSAAAHVSGLTQASPPDWAIVVTQWVVGTSLGARFAGFRGSQLWLALRLCSVSVAAALLLAAAIAAFLAAPVGEPMPAVILAFAPGGINEMSLVALSLQMSTVYVTIHHLARIMLAVVVARLARPWLPVPDRGHADRL
jgi:uncharacterized protein